MSSAFMPIAGGRQVLPRASVSLSTGMQALIAVMGLALLAALVFIGITFAQDPARFPVTNVDVLGTMDYADRDALMGEIKRQTANGFYGMDIDDLRQSLESNEWIANVRVRRIWPGRIAINVEEHEPAARWNDDHLISKRLVLFKPRQLDRQSADFELWSEVFRPLPQVIGMHGRHVELLDTYRSYDQSLARFNLSLDLLHEDDRLSQTLELSNGVKVHLGRAERQLRMERFLSVYERLAAQDADGSLGFDMRYTNGFALGGVSRHNSDKNSDDNFDSARNTQ